ncbi:hypothetical protein AAFF27_24765 [Xylophilus sp. GW821-FHT01B05]
MTTPQNKLHKDPITQATGAHPLGTGIGAGGGALTGAVLGAAGGPVGVAIGSVVGAVVGGLAGKGAAEAINPTVEDAYWRAAHTREPYYAEDRSFDDYHPAYRLGYEERAARRGRFDDFDAELGSSWERRRGESRLSWDEARPASRAAWERAERVYPALRHHLNDGE